MLPSIDWNLDPVAIRFPPFPLRPVALAVAGLGALSALVAWLRSRRGEGAEEGGVGFGITVAVIAVLAALLWPEARPQLELRYYSLLFVVVFLVGYGLLHWQIRRGGGGREEAGDFIVYGVIGVLAGARLGHVLFYDLDKAFEDPIWVFKIWTGGLSSHGAMVGLVVAMYLFTRARGIPFLEGADRFSFSAAAGAALVRIGNFCNSEIVGRKTDGTWGVRFLRFDHPPLDAAPDWQPPLRHPTQLYEAALALVTLVLLLVADRVLGKEKRPRAALISIFFLVYFTGRLGIEFTKEYQVPALEGTFTMGQYLSLLPAVLGWYGLWWSLRQRLPAGWVPLPARYEQAEEPEPAEPAALPARRLYDPDVEAVFGGRARPSRSERKRQMRSAERRRSQSPDQPGGQPEPGNDRTEQEEDSTGRVSEPVVQAQPGEGSLTEQRRKRRKEMRQRVRSSASPPRDRED